MFWNDEDEGGGKASIKQPEKTFKNSTLNDNKIQTPHMMRFAVLNQFTHMICVNINNSTIDNVFL